MHLPYFRAVHRSYKVIKECWEHYQWLLRLQGNLNELLLLCGHQDSCLLRLVFLHLALADSERI